MNRLQLEHAIRAATSTTRQDQGIIIGSQSSLGSFSEDDLPASTTCSDEVDICPLHNDDKESPAKELDAAIGEFSQFHRVHEFYVHGVGRPTAILPSGWAERLVCVSNENTGGSIGLCLEPHDLCVAKLLANRTKGRTFVNALIEANLVQTRIIIERLGAVVLDRFENKEREYYVYNHALALEWVRSMRD